MNYCNLTRLALSVPRLLDFRTVASKPVKTVITAEGKDVTKKKTFENRITLISPDNSISITDLKNAQSLSIRRELKLVKIQDVDSKTRRPVYKLMTNAEYHAEELAKRKEKQAERQGNKGEKLLTLSSRIGEHDLMTGVKKMMKLVEKQYEVKVIIAGEDSAAAQKTEKIYSVIENHVKSISKIAQKRMKGNNLRFQLLPLRQNSTQEENSGSNQSNNEKGPL
ncbi:mitochondrial translation initiation factor 3 [Anticarsia gemmatalis]|uniref:mitochondrial translation initiation factor 3 n=1 Tax=Anticarsia gemmatalis TaxID=129554 RepID=UPI003F75DA59